MSEGGRTYGGKSSEDRRAERRERLLAAALVLIGRQGLAAATVRGICAEAGLTPRYFYEEFGTVETLAQQLFDREYDAGLARVGTAVAAAGEATPERVLAAVQAVLTFVTEVPERAAVLLTEATGEGALAQRRHERMADVVAVIGAYGQSTYATGDAPADAAAIARSDRAVRSAATFVAGGLTQAIDDWLRGRLASPREELEGELAAQIVAVGDAAFAQLRRDLEAPPMHDLSAI